MEEWMKKQTPNQLEFGFYKRLAPRVRGGRGQEGHARVDLVPDGHAERPQLNGDRLHLQDVAKIKGPGVLAYPIDTPDIQIRLQRQSSYQGIGNLSH